MMRRLIAGMLVFSMLICCVVSGNEGRIAYAENAGSAGSVTQSAVEKSKVAESYKEIARPDETEIFKMMEGLNGTAIPKMTESLNETETAEENESLRETESSKETDTLCEIEMPKETDTYKETESPKETVTPIETESSTETTTSKETESLKETETPKETESPKETETPKEPEPTKEPETPKEPESPKETESSKEPETKPIEVSAPSQVTASCISYNEIKISWSKVKNASSYLIYRRKKGEDHYRKIARTSKTSHINKKVACGSTYYYKVKACITKDGKEYTSSLSKSYDYAKAIPSAPACKIKEARKNSVVIQWSSVKGADQYEVIYEAPGGKKYKHYVKSSKRSYEIKDIYTSRVGHATVRACHGSVKSRSADSRIEVAKAVPAIEMKSVYVGSNGEGRITWTQDREADGYLIFRKDNKDKKWKRIDMVDQTRCSYKDSGLSKSREYRYRVRGFRRLNRKAVRGLAGNSMQPTLTYSKTYVRNVTKTFAGKSGSGRKMYTFTTGSGSNHMVIVSEIHGYEDHWKKDSVLLIKTAEELIQYYAKRQTLLRDNDYQISVLPMANPDGYYDGFTCNGPGRCTTKRISENGRLVTGGLDLNRCFPTGFLPQYSERYYTGSRPLAAVEARVIWRFIDENIGKKKNQFIDMQGWYDQTITNHYASGIMYQAMKKYFPSARPATLGGGGYMASYAKAVGYDAVLFEFPRDVTSANAFYSREYDRKFIHAVRYILENS